MKAAVFEGGNELVIKDVPMPELCHGEDVIVKVKVAGICGADVIILSTKGAGVVPEGTILGHEFVGEVVEIGDYVKFLKIGDLVAVSNNVSCGYCEYCRKDCPNMCLNMRSIGIVEDGGFAEYSVVPSKSLFVLPKNISMENAVFAEPLSCVVNAVTKIKIDPSMSVVVLGGGPIGQLYSRLLKLMGVGKVILSEINQKRLRFALTSGVDVGINPEEQEIIEIVKKETKIGADLVIDTVGNLLDLALKIVRSCGNVILFGLAKDIKGEVVIPQTDIVLREIMIKGSYITNYAFPIALKIIRKDSLKLEELVTDRIELGKINDGIKSMAKGDSIKVLVYP